MLRRRCSHTLLKFKVHSTHNGTSYTRTFKLVAGHDLNTDRDMRRLPQNGCQHLGAYFHLTFTTDSLRAYERSYSFMEHPPSNASSKTPSNHARSLASK